MDLPFAATLLQHYVHWHSQRQSVRPLAELNLANIDRVLLVLTTGLGDAILSTPIFEAVRHAMPQARIGLFVRATWAPLFRSETDVNEIIPYPGKWRRFFSTLGTLRRFSPQLTLILHGNDPDILPMTYLAGSRFIVRIPTRSTRYGELLSNLARKKDQSPLPDRHYIDNRLRILDTVGIPKGRTTPILRLPKVRAVADWLHSTCQGQPYVVIHPWAADNYKTYPIPQARQLLERLAYDQPGLLVVITGTRQNHQAAESLARGLSHVHIAAGVFNIEGTATLLAGAQAVVAPDTGILHMAAALDVATVGLYSPTHPDLVGQRAATAKTLTLTHPLTCSPCTEKKCPHQPALCMTQFKPDEVMAALRNCLGKTT